MRCPDRGVGRLQGSRVSPQCGSDKIVSRSAARWRAAPIAKRGKGTETLLCRTNSFAAAWCEWFNFRQSDSFQFGDAFVSEDAAMLAEKFFLVLETLRSHASDD